uniref:Uncharacterized protein n=1 Tax=Meloidogyne incognita TaxID=6306 RepID=A0A914NTT6_MELIC
MPDIKAASDPEGSINLSIPLEVADNQRMSICLGSVCTEFNERFCKMCIAFLIFLCYI